MVIHPESISPELRAGIGEAVAHVTAHIKKAEKVNRHADKLRQESGKLEEEFAALTGKPFLSASEESRLAIVGARRSALASHLQEAEATMQPARRELVRSFVVCEGVLAKLATLASEQLHAEMKPALEPYFLPERIPAMVNGSDAMHTMIGVFMRVRYSAPTSIAEAVVIANELLGLLKVTLDGGQFYSFAPGAPARV